MRLQKRNTVWGIRKIANKLSVLLSILLLFEGLMGAFGSNVSAKNVTVTEREIQSMLQGEEVLSQKAGGMYTPNISCEGFEEQLQAESLSVNSVYAISGNSVLSENGVIKEDGNSTDEGEISSEGAGYSIPQDAVTYIRKCLVNREPEIDFILYKQSSFTKDKLKDLIYQAFDERKDGAPNEGDYLYWHIRGMSYRATCTSKTNGTYKIEIKVAYLSNAQQEKYVASEITKIINSLGLNSTDKTEYEKIKLIYDYLISHMDYDTAHYSVNQNYLPMYAAYSGLQDGYTVCQGYASLFYRIAKTVGISTRLIAGKGMNDNHGWNIVKVGEYYYNIDVTWDDDGTATSYTYFMKSMQDFSNHTRFEKYTTNQFSSEYPMSSLSYGIALEAAKYYQLINGQKTVSTLKVTNKTESYTDLDGKTVTTASQNGKLKLLIFVDPSKSSYSQIVYHLIDTGEDEKVDVIFFDTFSDYASKNVTSADMMQKLCTVLTKYGATASVVTSSKKTISLKNYYIKQTGSTTTSDCAYALIDSNNEVRFYGEGLEAMQVIDDAIQYVENDKYAKQDTFSILSCQQTKNDIIQIAFQPVEGATSYAVYRKLNQGNYVCLGNITGTSCKVHFSLYGTYTFQVIALKGNSVLKKSDATTLQTAMKIPSKGTSVTVNGQKYKVTSGTSKLKTVAFLGTTSKKVKNVVIPAKIEIDGIGFKVTEISAKACKKQTSLKTVLIGSNVSKIGASAFEGCKNLVALKINGKNLKKIGKKAFTKTTKKIRVTVPSSKLKKYKSMLYKSGISKSGSITK